MSIPISMVDAMNKMSELGWEFEQAYIVMIGGTSQGSTITNVHHWILSKTVGDDEGAGDGLKTYAARQKELKESAQRSE